MALFAFLSTTASMALFAFLSTTACAASSLLLGADAQPLKHGHPTKRAFNRSHARRQRVTVRVRGCDGTDRRWGYPSDRIFGHCGGYSADGKFKKMCVEE